MSDAYHTCYVLSGLSSAQHEWELDEPLAATGSAEGGSEAADSVWAGLPYLDGVQIFDNKDRVRPIHPVYAIPQQNVRAMKEYFRDKQSF